MANRQRMSAFDEANREGYNARLRGVLNKENPNTWNGTVFPTGTGLAHGELYFAKRGVRIGMNVPRGNL